MELQLDEFEVPPKPGQPKEQRVTVFFRIREASPESLRIELWERGDYYGSRKLSSQGTPRLVARRLALGGAELVRGLLERREREARAFEDEQTERERQRARLEELERWPGIMLETTATGAAIGPSDAWLAGTSLSGQLRFQGGSRVGLGVSWLFGQGANDASMRWLELAITPGHAFTLSPKLDLAIELEAAAATVHFTRVTAVDDIRGEHDTWTARATLGAKLEPRLGSGARLSIGPEFGSVLRRMHVEEGTEQSQLGGFWLGGSVGLVLDPLGRF
jgi:hypothetical protein